MNGYPSGIRAAPGQNGGLGWNDYHGDNFSRMEAEKDAVSESEIVLFRPRSILINLIMLKKLIYFSFSLKKIKTQ